MLQQRAQLTMDHGDICALHERAGNWFAQEGFVDAALHHFLLAKREDSAVDLIEANSKNLLNNLARQRLERWMELLPEEAVWQRPRLLVAKAWLSYRQGRLPQLTAILNQVEHCLDETNLVLSESERLFIQGQMYTLQSANFFVQENDPQKSAAPMKCESHSWDPHRSHHVAIKPAPASWLS